ncbi:MAG: RibD family protein [Verrucomicrobiales bacterium]|nr:RibD family protein [Verrucomicrobiales bacterium]
MNSKLKSRNSKLPFVFSNFAMTADGKIAFADHKFVPFSSRRDREHMMELRATADAVMCGTRTIEETGTVLGPGGAKFCKLRRKNGLAEYSLRVIVSGSGSVNPDLNIFKTCFSPVIVLTTARISKANLQKLEAVASDVKICGQRKINFRDALGWLRSKWNVQRLLCEGGGELHGTLVRAGLMDEIYLTICPKIFGGRTAPTIADGKGLEKLMLAAQFRLQSARPLKGELFTVLIRAKNGRFA